MGGKVKNENYITIQGWMINTLNLKGNELLIYAIIYGFSQTEGQIFSGSLQYLADWTNSTKQGVSKNLKSLVEKGYLIKTDKIINGVKFCEYYATMLNEVSNKVDDGIQQSLIPPMQQSLTNNIDLDNTSNNNINKKEYLPLLGEFENVLITQEELEKLKNKMPNYEEKIEDLSTYLANNPKRKYASHYATMLSWYRREQKDKQNKPNASNTYKRVEVVPEWMNKEVKKESLSADEQKEMNDLLKEFKDPDFEARRTALQERLKQKYKKA